MSHIARQHLLFEGIGLLLGSDSSTLLGGWEETLHGREFSPHPKHSFALWFFSECIMTASHHVSIAVWPSERQWIALISPHNGVEVHWRGHHTPGMGRYLAATDGLATSCHWGYHLSDAFQDYDGHGLNRLIHFYLYQRGWPPGRSWIACSSALSSLDWSTYPSADSASSTRFSRPSHSHPGIILVLCCFCWMKGVRYDSTL